jgi:DMSO/TMAO reductase YedYZ molybdopterin-dependent catalytic subunit
MVAPVPRWQASVAGVGAAAVALGVSELLAGAWDDAPSLVISVADVFIADTPGGVVRWSIDTFGTSQKTVLVIGIVAATLLIGGVLGLAGRLRPLVTVVGVVGFGVIGAWAASRDPLTSSRAGWLVALASTAAGASTFLLLARPLAPEGSGTREGASRNDRIGAVDRRRFLVVAGLVGLVGTASGEIGRRLRRARDVEAARDRVAAALGDTTRPTVPASVESFDGDPAAISPLVTPNADFYRIDTRILVPQVDADDWSLRVTGMVEHEVELTIDDVLAMDRITEYVTLACVSNEVGGDLVGNALWSGVPLSDLLALAGPAREADQIVGRAVDDWTAGFPTELAIDGRPSMVALTMNGEPLPVKHGFPARLIVPGLYGYVSATKWLTEIELTTWDAFDGYWIPRGWAKEGPIKTQSRIDVPRSGASVRAGPTAVAGVAWAPTRSIERVEVRVDDGTWQQAQLSGALSENTWVQWRYSWDAAPGRHHLTVRATDDTGDTQTADVASPAPSGATGHHRVSVEVT